MNKLAAYEVALQIHEQEKRAEFIIENFGTSQGEMPEAYLLAFDAELNKQAGLATAGRALSALGSGIGSAVGRAGSALASSGSAGGLRQTLGGAMERAAQGIAANPDTAGLVGAGAVGLGATGVGMGGTGFMAGRMTAPRPPYAQ
jgi:hypothetical protein